MTCRLLTIVLCVLAVIPQGVCTCAAAAVECHDARCRPAACALPDADAHHACCHAHEAEPDPVDEPAAVTEDPPLPHEHSRHDDGCRTVTAADPMLVAAADAGPASAAAFDCPVVEAAPCLVVLRDPARARLAPRLSAHISTVVLRI